MLRWGQIDRALDLHSTADACYRPDLYRDAAEPLDLAVPTSDHKPEGTHARGWMLTDATSPIAMGPDRFFDGRRFDPADPVGYLAGFDVHNLAVGLDALAAVNPNPSATVATVPTE
jgi:nitrate/nitrite transport system substrate-binding protein